MKPRMYLRHLTPLDRCIFGKSQNTNLNISRRVCYEPNKNCIFQLRMSFSIVNRVCFSFEAQIKPLRRIKPRMYLRHLSRKHSVPSCPVPSRALLCLLVPCRVFSCLAVSSRALSCLLVPCRVFSCHLAPLRAIVFWVFVQLLESFSSKCERF